VPTLKIKTGTAARIMTALRSRKALTPLYNFENTDEIKRSNPGSEIGILAPAEVGLNIRKTGEDVVKGTLTLKKGRYNKTLEVGCWRHLAKSKSKS